MASRHWYSICMFCVSLCDDIVGLDIGLCSVWKGVGVYLFDSCFVIFGVCVLRVQPSVNADQVVLTTQSDLLIFGVCIFAYKLCKQLR